MSVYSTCDITREDAIEAILAKIFLASDDQLEDMMFELYGKEGLEDTCLSNFRTVDSYDDSNYKKWDRGAKDVEYI